MDSGEFPDITSISKRSIINGSTKLIAILFDRMRCRVCFNFTLTLTLSLKGEGNFDYSLTPKEGNSNYFLSPWGED